MGLNATTQRLIIQQCASLDRRDSVLTYGVQDLYATYEELEEAFSEMEVPYRSIEAAERKTRSSPLFLQDQAFLDRGNVDASMFFEMLGFSKCSTLDALELDGPVTVLHDLNKPIPKSLHASHDLVIDGGTIEHVFDVAMALRNTVNLVRPGGLVMHASPVLLYDHGFYGINPTALEDWYRANDFDILASVCLLYDHQRGAYGKNLCFPYQLGFQPPNSLFGRYQMGVFFCARRTSDRLAIEAAPLQGVYATAAADKGTSRNQPQSPLRRQMVGLLPMALRNRLGRIRDEAKRRHAFRQVAYRL